MNTKALGVFALVGAPFLFIQILHDNFNPYVRSTFSGLAGLVYMTGWMCSIVALKRMKAFGESRFSHIIFYVQLASLALGNAWNIYEAVQPGADTILYQALDIFWPLSNVIMLITGIAIAKAATLRGWKRFVPLLVGMWLPACAIAMSLFTRNKDTLLFSGLYSAITWSLMAIMVILNSNSKPRWVRTLHPAV